MRTLGLLVSTLLFVGCGTETPRTFRPDAGFPAAPFDHPAPVVGAVEAGVSTDAGAVDAGPSDGGNDAAVSAPVSSVLVDVKPFEVVLYSSTAHELRLESRDGQKFVHRTDVAPGAWFASQRSELAADELARWSAPNGGLVVSFRRSSATLIVARVTAGADAGGRTTKEYRFAVPRGATLYVESRAP